MLVANLKFLNSLSPEDYQVFKEAAALSTEVEMTEWDKSVQEAKRIASEEMGVEFIDVDVEAFKEKVLPLHESMLQENEKIRDLYDHIQAANEKAKRGQEDGDKAQSRDHAGAGLCNHRSVCLYDPDRNVSDRNPLFF